MLAAISARIDALPPATRTALLHASVIGQTFWRDVLDGLGELSDVDEALEALEARGLVAPARRAGRGRRRVRVQACADPRHRLRDAPARSRRELHAATARYLEERSAPEPRARVAPRPPLARGRRAGARDRLPAGGGRRAKDALAVEETYDLYTRALDLADDEDRRASALQRAPRWRSSRTTRAPKGARRAGPALTGRRDRGAARARARRACGPSRPTDVRCRDARCAACGERGPGELEAGRARPAARATGCAGTRAIWSGRSSSATQARGLWSGEAVQTSSPSTTTCTPTPITGRALRARARALRPAGRRRPAGSTPHSAEFLLRGAGMTGLILAGLGRYEEALAAVGVGDRDRAADRPPANVVPNYSTLPCARSSRWRRRASGARRRRRLGPSEFNMPWINARADLIGAQLRMAIVARSSGRGRPWDDALATVVGALADHGTARGRTGPRWSSRSAGRRRGDLERASRSSSRPWTRTEVLRGDADAAGRALTARGDGEAATERARIGRRARRRARLAAAPLAEPRRAVAARGARREGSGGEGSRADAEQHAREAAAIIDRSSRADSRPSARRPISPRARGGRPGAGPLTGQLQRAYHSRPRNAPRYP